jgi:hypothetical protein
MKESRWTIIALGVWTLFGLAIALLERPLFDALWLGIAAIYVFFVLVGLTIALVCAGFAVIRKNAIAGAVAVSFVLIGIALFYCEPVLGAWGNAQIEAYRFRRDLPTYTKIIQKSESDPNIHELSGTEGNVEYKLDLGPPIRVGFPQPGGLLDNWEGVVYDPTGEVEKARGWVYESGRQEFTAPENVVRLFGGDIVSCVHIEGNFYRCWFT